jgi:hypothetical protein
MLLSIVPSVDSTISTTSVLSPSYSTASPPPSVRHLPQWTQGLGIPPERVGLHGEYDHAGLAKRVIAAFQKDEDFLFTDRIRVSQRGQVVILSGQVDSQDMLQAMIIRSLQVDGAAFVESNGVRVVETHCNFDAA